nr:uncharacterized protein LOC113826490 isoform X2 [Penaeus vannamei]
MSFIPATPLDSAPLPPRFHRHRDPPAVRPRVSSGRLSSTETIFRSLRKKKGPICQFQHGPQQGGEPLKGTAGGEGDEKEQPLTHHIWRRLNVAEWPTSPTIFRILNCSFGCVAFGDISRHFFCSIFVVFLQ